MERPDSAGLVGCSGLVAVIVVLVVLAVHLLALLIVLRQLSRLLRVPSARHCFKTASLILKFRYLRIVRIYNTLNAWKR